MRTINILTLTMVLLISACGMRAVNKPLQQLPQKTVYENDEPYIILQQPTTRAVATCYRSENVSAEACAKIFESNGFVRLRDIPYKTADYDFLKTDTYPTRRWRGNEDTPRW